MTSIRVPERLRPVLKRVRFHADRLRERLAPPAPTSQKWTFIVGCYNSGTTLLHDVLASHPAVGSMPDEGQFYTDELPLPKTVGLARLWAIEPERFYLDEHGGNGINVPRLRRQWRGQFNDPDRPVLIEKSPTNAARTRWLQRHFPNAHFIGIVRNGYAVAEGIRRKAGHSLALAAEQWARSNEIMLRDFEALERTLLVRYETLAEAPGPETARILAFLGLSPADLTLDDRPWEIHEQRSPIRDMNARSLEALGEDDRRVVHAAAGAMLERLGYR